MSYAVVAVSSQLIQTISLVRTREHRQGAYKDLNVGARVFRKKSNRIYVDSACSTNSVLRRTLKLLAGAYKGSADRIHEWDGDASIPRLRAEPRDRRCMRVAEDSC